MTVSMAPVMRSRLLDFLTRLTGATPGTCPSASAVADGGGRGLAPVQKVVWLSGWWSW